MHHHHRGCGGASQASDWLLSSTCGTTTLTTSSAPSLPLYYVWVWKKKGTNDHHLSSLYHHWSSRISNAECPNRPWPWIVSVCVLQPPLLWSIYQAHLAISIHIVLFISTHVWHSSPRFDPVFFLGIGKTFWWLGAKVTPNPMGQWWLQPCFFLC